MVRTLVGHRVVEVRLPGCIYLNIKKNMKKKKMKKHYLGRVERRVCARRVGTLVGHRVVEVRNGGGIDHGHYRDGHVHPHGVHVGETYEAEERDEVANCW